MALLLSSLAACSSPARYSPGSASPGITITKDRVSARNELLSVTADQVPSFFADQRMLIFRLAIRNTSEKPVPLGSQNIALLDAAGRQFAAMLPDEVAATGNVHCYPRWGYGMGMGWGWGWDSTWGMGAHWHDDYYCDPESNRLLSESLFPTAPVEPGAKVRGLIFFRVGSNEPQEATIVLRPPESSPIRLPFKLDPED